MAEVAGRAVIDAVYARLSASIEAKTITAEQLKTAALDALKQARIQIELEPDWVSENLKRLSGEQTITLPPLPDRKIRDGDGN